MPRLVVLVVYVSSLLFWQSGWYWNFKLYVPLCLAVELMISPEGRIFFPLSDFFWWVIAEIYIT